jgi:hypothetical protein
LVALLPPARVHWVLGSGFALTEFLIAPVLGAVSPRAICSLGALVNIMVVTCDRLIDRGASVDDVFRQGSPVIQLLERYRTALRELNGDARLHAISEKLIERMVLAERLTVSSDHHLEYRDWIRKSVLPIVLMGLSAWACPECDVVSRAVQKPSFLEHLRWLGRVGRFLGAVDDLADYDSDDISGHPNLFRAKSDQSARRYNIRMAVWCGDILYQWEKRAGASAKAVIFKETFLYLTWSWLNAG